MSVRKTTAKKASGSSTKIIKNVPLSVGASPGKKIKETKNIQSEIFFDIEKRYLLNLLKETLEQIGRAHV